MTKRTTSFRIEPETHKKIKLLAVHHDVFPGEIIEAGLLALEALSPLKRAELLASLDRRAGHVVVGDEKAAVAEDRHEQSIRAAEIEAATKESD